MTKKIIKKILDTSLLDRDLDIVLHGQLVDAAKELDSSLKKVSKVSRKYLKHLKGKGNDNKNKDT